MAASNSQPYLEILAQPSSSQIMEDEGTPDKNLVVAESKNKKAKTNNFIKIKINDPLKRAGQLVVTCVNTTANNELKYHVHPTKLSGQYCRSGVGVYQFTLSDTDTVPIEKLYIKTIKKEKYADSILNLQKLKIDPYKYGYNIDLSSINGDQMRLAFQAFLRDKQTPQDIKKMVFTAPIVSNIIYNSFGSIIKIDHIENPSDFANGGGSLILIIENLNEYIKGCELKVRFFDVNKWSTFAADPKIFNNCTVLVTVPQYSSLSIEKDVSVSFQVIVESKKEEGIKETKSDIHTFTYKPVVKATKRPIAYDEYYECEVQDSKNSVDISKMTRKRLAERTKMIWSIDKAKNSKNFKIDLELSHSKTDKVNENYNSMDFIGNNFLIKYSNEDNLHYLKPNLSSEDTSDVMDLDDTIKYRFLEKIVETNINKNKRIKQPTDDLRPNEAAIDSGDNSNDMAATASDIKLTEENVNDNKIYYNIEEILDFFE